MIELGIVGERNSGKTTLLEALVADLTKRGYRVATVKHTSHRHTFDQPGKDSYRHRRAGAGMTLAISGTELALFTDASDTRRQAFMKGMAEQFDICLIEGDRSSARPKLLVTRNSEECDRDLPGNIVALYGPPAPGIEAPCFALDDVTGLVEFITQRYLASPKEAGNA